MNSSSRILWLGVVVALAGLSACSGPALPDMDMTADEGETETPMVAVFQDPDSDFETSDVHDIDGEIVRFDAANGQLIWAADSQAFDNWDVDVENNLLQGGFFTIRFGTEAGQRMAYFTETNPPTICDLVVVGGDLSIFPTNMTVPQE